jgi:hypothetical protein
MTTHTPGPWHVHTNIGRKGETGVIADGAPCIIAIMGNQKEWPAETANNAQLIAAAPELLEALEEALSVMGEWGEDGDPEWAEQARAAIAKAKGE